MQETNNITSFTSQAASRWLACSCWLTGHETRTYLLKHREKEKQARKLRDRQEKESEKDANIERCSGKQVQRVAQDYGRLQYVVNIAVPDFGSAKRCAIASTPQCSNHTLPIGLAFSGGSSMILRTGMAFFLLVTFLFCFFFSFLISLFFFFFGTRLLTLRYVATPAVVHYNGPLPYSGPRSYNGPRIMKWKTSGVHVWSFFFSFLRTTGSEMKKKTKEEAIEKNPVVNDLKVPSEVQKENRKVHGNGSIRPLFVHSKFSTSACAALGKKKKKNSRQKERMQIFLANARTTRYSKSFFFRTSVVWNTLPGHLQQLTSPHQFKLAIREHFHAHKFDCLHKFSLTP